MKVWKTILTVGEVVEAKLPKDSSPCHFAIQGGRPTMWFAFSSEDESTLETRKFRVIATGQETPDSSMYVGTVIDEAGFVWHLVELSVPRPSCGVWIPFSSRQSAEEALDFIRDRTNGDSGLSLDGFCLDDDEAKCCGVFLPFANLEDSRLAARAVKARFGFSGLAEKGLIDLDTKKITLTAKPKPVSPGFWTFPKKTKED